ncbi:MAG TPA: WYL domain-containing transcriptional regulator [Cyclobacteriaceae bacterium]|nr:WYL domain-containing transcriptional regulator [Cyclobacteriaceae bacterium]
MARIQESSSPIPQAKLMRVLEFIAILKGKGKTVGELAAQFKMSERSVYRYVRLLEAVGFIIDKDFENRYFIFTSEDGPSTTNFSITETNILKTLIHKGAFDNPLRNSLLKKLSLNSELDDMPKVIVKLKIGQHIEKLTDAIKNKRQVILKGYHSANSSEIKNRLVEPFQFGTDYKSVIALDTNDQKCKQFKLERIDEVVDTKKKFKFESLHKKTNADIFGLSGETTTWITLKLTMRSYLLLREEYPLSIHYTERKGSKFLFHGPVTSFEGIGRFVLGLMDHVTIKEPKEFKKFIKQKLVVAQQSLK